MPAISRALAGAVLAMLLAAAPAGARVLSEAEVSGGFSDRHDAPTPVAPEVSRLEGTGAGGDADVFLIEAASPGALVLEIAAPEGIGWSYSAGGQATWREEPFRWGWDGEALGSAFQLGRETPTARRVLELPEGFAGPLHLALWFTHGADMRYAIDLPAAAGAEAAPQAGGADAAVPLPGALPLLGAALAGAGLLRLRRPRG
jgi:hypothetical protein